MKKSRQNHQAVPPKAGEDCSENHRYFRELEELFINLRGAPLLLSPADWKTAREWFRLRIPLDVIEGVLRELLGRHPERRGRAGVRSLRYFDSAVQQAWEEARELSADFGEDRAHPLDIPSRLEALAGAIPESIEGCHEMRQKVLALSGDAGDVEARLGALDGTLLERAIEALNAKERESIDREVGEAIALLEKRVAPEQRGEIGQQLLAKAVRRRVGLPVLSLFSPEASSSVPSEENSSIPD